MKYFMEQVTYRNDNSMVIQRKQCKSPGDAYVAARRESFLHYHDVRLVYDKWNSRNIFDCINDFGEVVELYAISFGDAAQITEGVFVL